MKIHFIAIGGAAMHNLAIALKEKNHQVTGSDDEIFEPSKSRLKKHGLLPESWGWFPDKIQTDLDAVILGMHARKDNPELLKAQALGLKIYSYPEFLYEETKNKKRLVIAGSHGKTTITSMLMHVLKYAGHQFDYMVGAQVEGFDTMVGLSDESNIAIFEGDEYLSSPIDVRPKFLWYKPHAAVITGIAWDHANVFPTETNYIKQFKTFIQSIQSDGKLFYYGDDPKLAAIANENSKLSASAHAYFAHPFEVKTETAYLTTDEQAIKLNIFGAHNMQNIQAARLLCHEAGVSDREFYEAISSFKGASRRLETLEKTDELTVFLDFAHAPSKVKATTEAVKSLNPERKLTAVLELHTFSSLNADFLPQYNQALSKADYAYVYFNPKVVEHKKLPPLSPDFVKSCFGDMIEVFTDAELLMKTVKQAMHYPGNLLIMTSGNFDGQNIRKFAESIKI
ncbi:MAG: Mur ligase family protein [Bacteroidota bacterium]|nr:Mur ligase family protein [Bacteroidota bacterium]